VTAERLAALRAELDACTVPDSLAVELLDALDGLRARVLGTADRLRAARALAEAHEEVDPDERVRAAAYVWTEQLVRGLL
jgi:hypothetical protein